MFFKCQRREGWFFWHPPACFSIYGNVYPPHWSIGREGGDSGFRRSRIWILASRNKVAPSPPPLPLLSFAPCSGSRGEKVSVLFPSGLGTTSLQRDSGCVRESEGQRKASCLWGLTAREYFVIARASDISARRPTAQSPEGWFACMVMGHVAGSASCFRLGCGQLLSQGNTSHSGIQRRAMPEEKFYSYIKN